ncbi:CR3L3 protein, partial [Amia calva]|nr:CR3L3 protein [Amia calva]
MSFSDDLGEMDSAELLGLLFQDGSDGVDQAFTDGADLMAEWGLADQDMLNDIETEEFLKSILGPLEEDTVPCQSLSPLGSDSGISEDNINCSSSTSSDGTPSPSPKFCEPISPPEFQIGVVVQTDHTYSLQHGLDASDTLLSVRTENPDTDVFIDLDDWDSECMVEEDTSENPVTLAIEDAPHPNKAGQFQFKEIVLTEEEKRILAKEGVSIPTQLPLTKSEERTLKRVRRKIRNKQSAQESRKKKKIYVDGLESRVAVCTAHNQELQKKVQHLQKQNISLIEQLRKLQSLMKHTTMKTTTTSTCIMVFVLSFCLIIFPSVNPFGRSVNQKEVYVTSGVLSRTLRSLPSIDSIAVEKQEPPGVAELETERVFMLSKVENSQSMLSGGQNHTPDFQKVDQAESESAVNSNSSSDFPSPEKPSITPASGQENHRGAAGTAGALDYKAPGPAVDNDKWIDQKTTSVIIQQHRSDEM